MVFLINGKEFKFKSSNAKLIYDESYTEEVKTIKVESTSTDIKVVENDTNEINVKIYDEKEQKDNVEVKVNNGTLEIYDKKENNFHLFSIGFIAYIRMFSNFKIIYGVLSFVFVFCFYIYSICIGFLIGICINNKNKLII
jgi:hypothetical protein